jgi:hypothetical protein
MMEFELGQAVRLTAAFLDANGAAANPTSTTFKYGVRLVNPPPDPTATTVGPGAPVINPSTGNFYTDITPSVPGDYVFQAIGTGTVAAVATGGFRVKPSPFA